MWLLGRWLIRFPASATPHSPWFEQWGWTAALFALASFVETMGFGHLGAFTPLYLRELGVDAASVPQWTGVLAAASFVLGLPLAPFWGVWADRYSQKLIIVRSTLGEGLIFFLFSIGASPWTLLVARMLVGFILGNTGVMYAVLADRAPPARLPMAIGLVTAGSTLGMSVGPFLGGWLTTLVGLSHLYLLDAGAAWAVGLLLIWGLRERPRTGRPATSAWALLRALPGHLTASPTIPWLFGLYFLAMLGSNMQGPFVPLVIEEVYEGSDLPLAIGVAFLGMGLLSAISGPVLGRAAAWGGPRRVLAASLAVGAATAAGQAAASAYWQVVVLRAATGAAQGGTAPLLVSMIATATPPERRSSVLNIILFPAYFAWLIGGLAGAALAGVSVRGVFVIAAIVLAGAAVAPLAARSRLGSAPSLEDQSDVRPTP